MDSNMFWYHTICCVLDVIKEFLILRYVIGFQLRRKTIIMLPAIFLVPVGIAVLGKFIPTEYLSIMYIFLILIVMQIVFGIWYVKSFLLSIIAFVCICELDFFIGAFLGLLTGNGDYSRNNIMIGIVSILVIGIIAAVCGYYDISFYKRNRKHRKMFIVIELLVLFINLGIMGTFFGMLSESSRGSYAHVMLILVIILSMLLSVITLIFYTAIMNVKEYRTINMMNEKQLHLQEKHYEQLRETDRETRKFRHDLKNHLFVLSELLQEGKQEQAKKYLADITGQLSEVQKLVNSGNGIVDAILNEKFRVCTDKRISLSVDGIIYAPVVTSDYDICTILVNAMDNAVEACERIQDGAKWIKVSIGMYQDYLHLVISNSTVEGVELRSRKKDWLNHGFGLENLKECVEKNQGRMSTIAEREQFILDILIKAFEEEKI